MFHFSLANEEITVKPDYNCIYFEIFFIDLIKILDMTAHPTVLRGHILQISGPQIIIVNDTFLSKSKKGVVLCAYSSVSRRGRA